MEYMTTVQTAEKWDISDRRVRILCQQGRIEGAYKDGRSYLVPMNAAKPVDGRTKSAAYIVPQAYENLLSYMEAQKRELDSRRLLTPGEMQRLRKEFLTDYTYNSNAIEGNTLTLRETAMVLEGVTIDKKPLKDHLEAIGHRDAFLYVEKFVKSKAPFTEKVIRYIHSLVLMDRPEDKGVYRRIPVTISGAYVQPPQPYLVPKQMEDLALEWKLSRLHPICTAALLHLKFEGVHPFIDGNGRTGRLLLNFSLMKNGYPPINVKYADRRAYYDCFDTYYRDGNAAPMVELVAGYVSERLEMYLRVLEG